MSYISIHKWILPNQMRERWFSQVKKMIPPIRIVNNVFLKFFHVWEKWYVQSEDIEVCEFRAKIHPFYRRLQLTAPFAAPIRSLSMRKVFLEEFFSWKSEKHLWNWSGIVLFVSLSVKKTVQSQQNNSRRRKREQAVSLHYAFYPSYFVFYLHVTLIKLTFKLAILLKFIQFPSCIQNKQLLDYL